MDAIIMMMMVGGSSCRNQTLVDGTVRGTVLTESGAAVHFKAYTPATVSNPDYFSGI